MFVVLFIESVFVVLICLHTAFVCVSACVFVHECELFVNCCCLRWFISFVCCSSLYVWIFVYFVFVYLSSFLNSFVSFVFVCFSKCFLYVFAPFLVRWMYFLHFLTVNQCVGTCTTTKSHPLQMDHSLDWLLFNNCEFDWDVCGVALKSVSCLDFLAQWICLCACVCLLVEECCLCVCVNFFRVCCLLVFSLYMYLLLFCLFCGFCFVCDFSMLVFHFCFFLGGCIFFISSLVINV